MLPNIVKAQTHGDMKYLSFKFDPIVNPWYLQNVCYNKEKEVKKIKISTNKESKTGQTVIPMSKDYQQHKQDEIEEAEVEVNLCSVLQD